jgi:hypothetical protein
VRLRVWSEFLGFEELRSPRVLDLLARYGVAPCVQVTSFEGLAPVLRAHAERGLDTAVWLLLPQDAGYWPSERNAELYSARVDALLSWAGRQQVRVPWLAVDLERPLWQAQMLGRAHGSARGLVQLRLAIANLNSRRFARASAMYRAMAQRAESAGVRLLCAAHDYVLADLLSRSHLLQDLHEAPVLPVPWAALSVMLYTSLGCDRRWLYEVARQLKLRLGGRAAASIGLTGVGVLGTEPHYTLPEELAPDVAALKAAGVEDVAVYNLEGILSSARPEAWFEMLEATPPVVPDQTPASRRKLRQLRLWQLLGLLP